MNLGKGILIGPKSAFRMITTILLKITASYDDTGNEKAKEVLVKMTNLKTNQVWVWSKAKFINRKYLIEELYNQMICEGRQSN